MKITLTEEDRTILESWVKSGSVGDKQRLRARMVLMTADDLSTKAIMATLKANNTTLNKWRARYFESGVGGLKKGKTRPSRIPPWPRESPRSLILDADWETGCRHTVELSHDGASGWHIQDGGTRYLAGT